MSRRLLSAIIIGIVLNVQIAGTAKAGIANELGKFYEKQGYNVNATGSAAYRSQSAGYYYGGRVVARNPSMTLTPFHLQAPYLRADCEGIDAFMGSFQFIEMKQLVEMLKKIGKGATGYAFNLAMQTMVPQVYNTIQKLQDIAREINNFNINNCKAAATFLGGVLPVNETNSAYLCNRMGTTSNMFSDYSKARMKCGNEGERGKTLGNKEKKQQAGFEDVLGDEFNLVWKAIKSSKAGSVMDNEVAELYMTITGTIIMKQDRKSGKTGDDGAKGEDTRLQPQTKDSLAKGNNDLIEAFMYGEKGRYSGDEKEGGISTPTVPMVYQCTDGHEEDKCLDVKEVQYKINKNDNGWVDKIHKLLDSIRSKIKNREALDGKEQGLIEMTSIPILKIIGVEIAYSKGSGVINITQFSEAIAYDMVIRYMEQVTDFVSQRLGELEKVQVSSHHIEALKRDLRDVSRRLANKRNALYQELDHVLGAMGKAGRHEQYLRSSTSGALDFVK
ncbi:conjugal transfer protein TraH [Rickettsiales endosymbiont of Trichoplax sp. H2]|uniref:conjugal transfer protein TraH n=1 Tax=Rickettsiales endosymbiont of Trichoplax sp. H2 TaxID=2021221 RepID=UPI0012B3BA02|nr:conjugal transfer protein TraH [Rickettsiales endosymbiont of Trichoplax sp. H2]MSO14436.1 Protein TraH [Rickettsiales endosymbiont of Trichoplax sp. H2]